MLTHPAGQALSTASSLPVVGQGARAQDMRFQHPLGLSQRMRWDGPCLHQAPKRPCRPAALELFASETSHRGPRMPRARQGWLD